MSTPSTVDSSSEKDEDTLEERLAKISHEKLVQEVISVWDEAMKMEHSIKATETGKIAKVMIQLNDQVDNGATLLVLEQ